MCCDGPPPPPPPHMIISSSSSSSSSSSHSLLTLILLPLILTTTTSFAAALNLLQHDYYRDSCPNVESIVRSAVHDKFRQTFVTAPATLRLFFHDCFVHGCDASIMVASRNNNTAEKDHSDNMSLAGDGFDTVIKAKAAVDRDPNCRNKVSCADILAMATRDVVALTGGPSYSVELGRLDGKISRAHRVDHRLPHPELSLNKLIAMFASHGLTQTDLIALSGAHTIGFSHCNQFSKRIYNFDIKSNIDPSLDQTYAKQLKEMCPEDVDPRIAIPMDPNTPLKFDNMYYKNLQQGMGLFTSDQSLFTSRKAKKIVNLFASNNTAFQQVFVSAITKLGRVGVITKINQGEIRHDCTTFN